MTDQRQPGKTELSPNARAYWERSTRPFSGISTTPSWHSRCVGEPDAKGRQRMDDSNAKALMQSVEDGFAVALMIDDRHMTVGTLRQERDKDGVGCVVVTVRPVG